jgi:hypothetical protein
MLLKWISWINMTPSYEIVFDLWTGNCKVHEAGSNQLAKYSRNISVDAVFMTWWHAECEFVISQPILASLLLAQFEITRWQMQNAWTRCDWRVMYYRPRLVLILVTRLFFKYSNHDEAKKGSFAQLHNTLVQDCLDIWHSSSKIPWARFRQTVYVLHTDWFWCWSRSGGILNADCLLHDTRLKDCSSWFMQRPWLCIWLAGYVLQTDWFLYL